MDGLQPDISAPGVEILAAYSPLGSPSEEESDKRRVKYSVMSGTSMSCPHVAGVAAYIRTFHPKWSPSVIQSAIMTTGKQKSNFYFLASQVTCVDNSVLILSLNESLQLGR